MSDDAKQPDHEEPATDPSASGESSPEHAPDAEPADQPESSGPSIHTNTLLMAAGFVAIVLVGVLIFQAMLPEKSSGRESPDTGERSEIEALQAEIQARRAELSREREALGMEPLDGGSDIESADQIAGRLQSDAATLASLADSFEQLLARKEARIDELRGESVTALQKQQRAQQEQQRLSDTLGETRRELDRALVDASAVKTLRADLAESEKRNDALSRELEKLRSEPEELRAQLEDVRRERDRLRTRVGELESQLRDARIFASSESELLEGGVALFRSLRELEGSTPSELSRAYSRFGAELGANVLETCRFETDASEVTSRLEEQLRSLPAEAPEDALLFVAGYASETGEVEANRLLSSKRARAVARYLDTIKRPDQQVQAVYLGQTSRFSPDTPEENQRVEIWRVLPTSE